jgi:hypothetical protein
MLVSLKDVEHRAEALLHGHSFGEASSRRVADCVWLQAVGYPGLKILLEALADTVQTATLEKDLMGLDLQNISCVFMADQIEALYAEHGRMFLRNVRHGLYLVPMSVRGNYGIGCPVDPAFALGGERTKNPYTEKIEIAQRDGVTIDDAVWQSLQTTGA